MGLWTGSDSGAAVMAKLEFGRLRVLAVVDDPFQIKMLRAQLQASGIDQVSFVTQPALALDALKSRRPSLMICDHSMEPVTGIGLIREIRANTQSPFRFIPIILLAGYVRSETLRGALWTLGVDAILDTPVSVPRLRDAIESLHQQVLNQIAANGSATDP